MDWAERENDKHLALDHALDRIRVLEAELALLRDVAEAAERIEGHAETCPISAPGGRELPHGSFCDCGREKLGDALMRYRSSREGGEKKGET